MKAGANPQLRILLADGQEQYLEFVAQTVTRLGHSVVAKETDVAMVAALTEVEPPDVAIVVLGGSTDHALTLIRKIVGEAACPAIVILTAEDPAFVQQAAKCGVFAYIANAEMSDEQLASSIEVVLHRFAEYHDLQGAFGRRALTERAKGVLMERHAIDEQAAFLLLRDHARRGSRKLIDVARAVLETRDLLANTANASPEDRRGSRDASA